MANFEKMISWFAGKISDSCYSNESIECLNIDPISFSAGTSEKLMDIANSFDAIATSHFSTCKGQTKKDSLIEGLRTKSLNFTPLN